MSLILWNQEKYREKKVDVEGDCFVVDQYESSMDQIYIKSDQPIFVRNIDSKSRGKKIIPKNSRISVLEMMQAVQPYKIIVSDAAYIGSFSINIKATKAWQKFTLNVRAGSLTEADLNQMLEDILILAADENSNLVSQLTFRSVDVGDDEHSEFNRIFGLSEADLIYKNNISDIEHCAKVFIRYFKAIKKRSLKEMDRNLKTSPRYIAIKTQSGLKNYIKNPSEPKVLHRKAYESINCSENQFILWVLEHCIFNLRDSVIYKDLLSVRKDDFFSHIQSVKKIPKASYRLMNTQGYAQIYAEFYKVRKYFSQSLGYGVNTKNEEKKQVEYGISKTWKCYEVWCLLQLYHMLVSRGLIVESGEGRGSFCNLLEIKNGNIVANKNGSESTLFDNYIELKGDDFKVKLYYEPQQYFKNEKNQGYKPDFVLTVDYFDKKLAFIFDAKYRKYNAQMTSAFKADLDKVSRYFSRFHILDKINCYACILHSDKSKKSSFETQFHEFTNRNNAIGILPLIPSNKYEILNALKLLVFGEHTRKIDECFECGSPFIHRPQSTYLKGWTTQLGIEHPQHQKYVKKWLEDRYLPVPFDFRCANAECAAHYQVNTCTQDPTHLLYTNMRVGAIQLHRKDEEHTENCPYCKR